MSCGVLIEKSTVPARSRGKDLRRRNGEIKVVRGSAGGNNIGADDWRQPPLTNADLIMLGVA